MAQIGKIKIAKSAFDIGAMTDALKTLFAEFAPFEIVEDGYFLVYTGYSDLFEDVEGEIPHYRWVVSKEKRYETFLTCEKLEVEQQTVKP